MYTVLASWFHLLTRPEEYAEEAEFYHATLLAAGIPDGSHLLELGSGGGNNASHLKQHYRMTLVDLSPDMLAISQEINPELEHIQGDMRSTRLGRTFDAVFIQDAISYITSEADLLQTFITAYTHCRPSGVALFHPDDTRETFKPGTDHGGSDTPGGSDAPGGRDAPGGTKGLVRGMRYLEWTFDPDPDDSRYTTDFSYLLHLPDGSLHGEHERHELGLFSTQTWLDLIRQAGFEPQAIPFVHSELPPGSSTLFLGRRPK
jgi:SAM-dependent methyltransferase